MFTVRARPALSVGGVAERGLSGAGDRATSGDGGAGCRPPIFFGDELTTMLGVLRVALLEEPELHNFS